MMKAALELEQRDDTLCLRFGKVRIVDRASGRRRAHDRDRARGVPRLQAQMTGDVDAHAASSSSRGDVSRLGGWPASRRVVRRLIRPARGRAAR